MNKDTDPHTHTHRRACPSKSRVCRRSLQGARLLSVLLSVTGDPGRSLQLCTKQTVHCKPVAHGLKSCPKTPDPLSVLFIKLLVRRGLRVKTHIKYFQCRIFFESVLMVYTVLFLDISIMFNHSPIAMQYISPVLS